MFQTSLGRDGKSFYRDKVWSRDNITITINYSSPGPRELWGFRLHMVHQLSPRQAAGGVPGATYALHRPSYSGVAEDRSAAGLRTSEKKKGGILKTRYLWMRS